MTAKTWFWWFALLASFYEMYRYLPVEHQLLQVYDSDELGSAVTEAALGQIFAGRAPVVFIWTAVPYRLEWRYGMAAHKVIALDAGHVCQNLYLACEAIGAGTCAIGAYDQELMDDLVGLHGPEGSGSFEGNEGEEFVVYLAPVGKVS